MLLLGIDIYFPRHCSFLFVFIIEVIDQPHGKADVNA